ncbi:MAG: hypothetical protein M0R48_08860 [Candidatus Omnitrophica bacterium]|jgi:hypothetical protein|nr:hypothetical protein [Candidatus Omnitrophota bacterium]
MEFGKTRCALNYSVYIIKNGKISVSWCRNCPKAKKLKYAFCLLSKKIDRRDGTIKIPKKSKHKIRFNFNIFDDCRIFSVGLSFRIKGKTNG